MQGCFNQNLTLVLLSLSTETSNLGWLNLWQRLHRTQWMQHKEHGSKRRPASKVHFGHQPTEPASKLKRRQTPSVSERWHCPLRANCGHSAESGTVHTHRMDPHRNLVWMSSLKSPGIHQEGGKKGLLFIIPNEAFWGQESRFPKQVQKWLERADRRD